MHKSLLLVILVILKSNLFSQIPISDTTTINELDEVTIVGDNSKKLPGAGQYIDSKKLDKLNQVNINNVLRTIPGINIRDEEGFGLRPNIGLRGTPVNRSAKITLMEDGMLIAPAPYADPSAYYFPTFVRMQGVEVLKGSSQIKYGPYTIGGAINLISTPIPNAFKGFGQLFYGSYHNNLQRFYVGESTKNFDYVFEINRLASNGFKELDNGDNTGFERRDVMGKLRWHTNKTAAIPQSVTLKFVDCSEIGNETYLGLTFEDNNKNPLRRYLGTQKDILNLNHQHISLTHHIILAKSISINTVVYHSNTFRDWARANSFGGESIKNILNNPIKNQFGYKVMSGEENGDIQYTSAARTYFSKGAQMNVKYFFNTKKIEHKIHIGLRYHIDEADRFATNSLYKMTNGVMIPSEIGINGNQENQIRSASSFASFLNYDLAYKGLTVTPGLRHEHINLLFQNFGNSDYARQGSELKTGTNTISIFLPGLGINYGINKQMNIFGGVHRGFSPPGMPLVNTTAEQAKVESSINYELGYRIKTNKINIEATTFLNNYSNILGSDNVSGGGAGTGEMFNAGKAKIQGIELSLDYNLLNEKKSIKHIKIPVNIAYTYTLAKFKETFVNGGGDWGSGTIYANDFIPFITPHLLTTSLGFENKIFNANIICRYTSQTRVVPGQGAFVFPAQNNSLEHINSIEDYLIFDLSANYKLNKTFTLFILLNNFTNNKAIVASLPQGYRPNAPLGLNFGIKANFN